ncbi:MAG: acyl-CoA thioesterase [Alphaproteobacteria bacterium]
MESTTEDPQGEVSLRTFAMPADTNAAGDIFGGWIMSQMDLAGAACARRRAQSRVATVAVDAMAMHKPVYVGDELTCYTTLLKVGRTSLAVHVEAWVKRGGIGELVKVTSASFTFVAIGEDRKPREVPPAPAE